MKFLKYIAAAILLVAGLASCNGDGEKGGTVGKTTVQFSNAEVKSDFVNGVVYVPISITADTEADMNSCAVQLKVKTIPVGGQFEGRADVDYLITSCDLNIPSYNSYYDEKDPKKYYNEETQKWTREVKVEVVIGNTKPDEIHFGLEIESATTEIGAQKQCSVIIKKSNRDRFCTLYSVTYEGAPFWIGDDEEKNPSVADHKDYGKYFNTDATKYAWSQAQIIWVNEYDAFAIVGDNLLTNFNIYYWAYYDDTDLDGDPETDDGRMYFIKEETLSGWDWENIDDDDDTNDVAISALVMNLYDTEASDWVTERRTYWEYDKTKGTLSIPANLAFTVSEHKVINNQDIGEYIGNAIPAYKGVVFTKAAE